MGNKRIAVIGVGATGAVLAAALLKIDPEIILVDPAPGLKEVVHEQGINISGVISYSSMPAKNFHTRIADIRSYEPDIILISTKTFILPKILDEIGSVFKPGTKIVSTHNGLGTEDLIAERFGMDSAFRMSLNYGAVIKGPGSVETTFFNRPNHLGALSPENNQTGKALARLLTDGGLDTEYVDDIKLFVWKKMIMKCSMASICAVTDRTIKELLDFPPTREIAEACFNEALDVARATGYDLGDGYIEQALGYLEQVGKHKDSMCQDIANKMPTEIDFLGGKVVEYAREKGISTPFYIAMTNLVKAIEDSYMRR